MRDPGHNGMHTLSGDKPTNPSALVVKAAFYGLRTNAADSRISEYLCSYFLDTTLAGGLMEPRYFDSVACAIGWFPIDQVVTVGADQQIPVPWAFQFC
jgi:hypothetical protein